MMEHSAVLHALHRTLEACGLLRISVQDLRHTAATYVLSIGTHPRVVQDLLGHSSYTLTMNTYSHVAPGLHKDVANQMDRLFGRQKDVSCTFGRQLGRQDVKSRGNVDADAPVFPFVDAK